MTDVELFQLAALKSALKLETLGMKRRGKSVYSIVKQRFGFKGNKEAVLKQLIEYIESMKLINAAQKSGKLQIIGVK